MTAPLGAMSALVAGTGEVRHFRDVLAEHRGLVSGHAGRRAPRWWDAQWHLA